VVVTTGELPAAAWASAVELGAERVAVLPTDEAWLLSRASSAVRSPAERGWLVAVGGSCGGAGASTLATAVALAAGPRVLLVDGDPWGGGLDLLLGAERADGLRWPGLATLRGRVAGDALLAALPEVRGVHVLASAREGPEPVPEEAFVAVVEAARSVGCSVVVDVSRSGPPGASAVVGEADLAVLVVPGRLRAATAARLLVAAPGSAWSSAQLVAGRVPGGLDPDEVESVVGRPVLAELPHDRSAVPRGERGEPPDLATRSPLGVVARRILAAVP
jgi:secretion/DNA translocation related CpaE-like protein